MDARSFVAVCFSDLAGQVRGHGVPRTAIAELYQHGLPWPADLAALTAFGEAVATPWDGNGGLRLLPDANAEVSIDFGEEAPSESFVLGSIQTSDQKNWGGCTRSFLQGVVDTLKSEFNLDVSCNYEHQFSLLGNGPARTTAMSLSALRRERRFAGKLAIAVENAGITLVRFGAGAGERQFTATTKAKFGVSAADSAVIFRQLVHATAEQLGHSCSFAPLPSSTLKQNGVVLGIDLFDDGDQVTYDSTSPNGISATLGSFIAGILRHLPALRALTQPSILPAANGDAGAGVDPSSALKPNWRGAPISINPAFGTATAIERGYSFAFAAADATACPYLQLGALLCAGLQGLREALPMPENRKEAASAPEILFNDALDHGGPPCNLSEALAALAKDKVFKNAFPDGLLDAYANVKRAELATAAQLSPAELSAWSEEIY
jgi:glutamine synthetase